MISRLLLARKIYTNQPSIPRKLILVYLDVNNDTELAIALARRIETELKAVHLNVSQTDKLINSAHIPMTVVVTDQTMIDGVLKLKHFEPSITEEVHISNLKDRLLMQTGNTDCG